MAQQDTQAAGSGNTQTLVDSDACPLSPKELEHLANEYGSSMPTAGDDEVVLIGRPAYGRAAQPLYVPADVVHRALSDAYSAAMQPPERPLTRLELEQLANEHGSAQPIPGRSEVQLRYRPAFGAEVLSVYVPVEAVNRAISAASHASASGDSTASMATTSAGVAPGSTLRAIASAVISRSNTRPAARASSLSPLRSMLRRRSSKAPASFNLVMGSLSVVVVVEDLHRKTETGTHPIAAQGGAA